MQQLGQNGMAAPSPFGRAQKNMEGASGALRRTERSRALGEQGEAMDNLRQGAEAMAREMMQQGNGQQGNYGRHGEARGDDRDPLGRPLPSRGDDFGPERDMLPDEAAIERASEILEYLRNRANDANRPAPRARLLRSPAARLVLSDLNAVRAEPELAGHLDCPARGPRLLFPHHVADEGQLAKGMPHVHAEADDEFVGTVETLEVRLDFGGPTCRSCRAAPPS